MLCDMMEKEVAQAIKLSKLILDWQKMSRFTIIGILLDKFEKDVITEEDYNTWKIFIKNAYQEHYYLSLEKREELVRRIKSHVQQR